MTFRPSRKQTKERCLLFRPLVSDGLNQTYPLLSSVPRSPAAAVGREVTLERLRRYLGMILNAFSNGLEIGPEVDFSGLHSLFSFKTFRPNLTG